MLSTVGGDKLGVWAISQVNSRDVFWHCASDMMILDSVCLIFIRDWGEVSHKIWVSCWILVENSINQKHRGFMEDPLKSVSKDFKLLLERKTVKVLEVLEEILSQLFVIV